MEREDFMRTMPPGLRDLVRQALAIETVQADTAEKSLLLIDNTSLKNDAPMHGGESAADIARLCQLARDFGNAAVCVYPNQIVTASTALEGSGVRLAVVNNFSDGIQTAYIAAKDAVLAIDAGAQEIDTVIDRQALMNGDPALAAKKLQAVFAAVRDAGGILKTILQASTYSSHAELRDAAHLALDAGCDFIKTCTGKQPLPGLGQGLDISNLWIAATVMHAVAEAGATNKKITGVKISGGIQTALDCERMRFLHAQLIGADYFTPDHFRFGASSLAANLKGAAPGTGY